MDVRRQLIFGAILAGLLVGPEANAQTFFYNEVMKDGRIYVFADASRHAAFVEGVGTQSGPVVERPGYGPNGETVVFDSRDAINLYNFRHGLPGEFFAKPEEAKKPDYPFGKFSGLMFGDYYWYFERHQDGISLSDRRRSKDNTASGSGEFISPTTSPTTRSSPHASGSKQTATVNSPAAISRPTSKTPI